MKAMQKMFQRKAMMRPLDTHIAKKDISIDERTEQIRDYFKTRVNKKVRFEELLV